MRIVADYFGLMAYLLVMYGSPIERELLSAAQKRSIRKEAESRRPERRPLAPQRAA